MKKRISKSLLEQLRALDDHLHLLRQHCVGLEEDQAYLKALSAELRVLVCISSGTEGLLWRMVDRLNVPDAVELQLAGNVNVKHPLAAGLSLVFVPIQRAGFGHSAIRPDFYSLRKVIKNSEAVFVLGEGVTHEHLIKAFAQQMGSAHEDDDIELPLATLNQMLINGTQPYVPILVTDSQLVLQVGERVLNAAEGNQGYSRKVRGPEYGNFSVVLRMGYYEIPTSKVMVVALRSFVAEVDLIISWSETDIICEAQKGGIQVKRLDLKHPSNWEPKVDAVLIISYSSRAKQIHAIVNGQSQDDGVSCDIGWVHAEDLFPTEIPKDKDYPVYRQFLLTYSRLLSSSDCHGFLELQLQNDGNWKSPDGTLLVGAEENENDRRIFPI
jgi:hypothetical protein